MKIYKNLALSLFAIVLALLCVCALPQTAQAASESDLTFTLNETGDGYIVSDCNESASGRLTIPATYNGLPVTTIGDNAFSYCRSLTSVTIPDSVTTIGELAFVLCSNLTSVTIPNSVTSIGHLAFSYCTNLTSVTIPNGVTSIGHLAFSYCTNLTGIAIPDSVSIIGSGVFGGCSNLTSLQVTSENTAYYSIGNCIIETASKMLVAGCQTSQIPADGSVTTVGDYAFCDCTSLTSVTIPDSVATIGDYAFYGCTSLTSVTIPDSVATIGDYAFYGCTNLTSITIPNSVATIGDYAFYSCTSLTSITIPDSVTTIGPYAFYDCDSLTSVTIPDSVTTIGDYAFSGCDSLTSVTIPDSVTTIGDWAFSGCTVLTSIAIPDSVTSIGNRAFYICTSLSSVTIPDSVTIIGSGVFGGCSNLTSLQVMSGNTVYHSAGNCIIETANKTLIVGCKTSQVPNDGSVTSIGDYAFVRGTGLTGITIPNSVTTIGEYAFSGCLDLVSITIPDSVTTISEYAFSQSGLTSVCIPNSVTAIGDYAFFWCFSLRNAAYCGTQEQWDAIEIGNQNEPLTNATLRFHNYENRVCTVCGKVEDGVAAVTLSAPEGDIHRGDEVAVTVSVPAIEHCTTGGFLFSFDTDIFEYVSGEALVSGYGAAGISQINGNIAGYFMSGEENIQGDIFRIILRVKDNAPFADYTISGEASFSVRNSSEKVPNVVIGTTATVTCDHSYGDWVHIDEIWSKHTCTICSYEETGYTEYTVTFQYADGTVISAVTYHYGDTINVPRDPAQVNSIFRGWDREIVACTGDAVYTAVFEVYVSGDINGDDDLTYNDAVYLLLHTMFGEERYPLSNAPSDIDGNGLVNDDDAVYLLLHVFYGEENYPLKKA